MGVLKNDVGRPSNKTIKTRRLLLFLAFIIVFIIALVLGMHISNYNKTEEKEATKVEEEKISAKDAEKIVYDFFGEDLISLIGKYIYKENGEEIIRFNEDEFKTSFTLLNNSDKFIKSNKKCSDYFSPEVLTKGEDFYHFYLNDFEGLCAFDENFVIPYDKINKIYKDLFGNKNNALKSYIQVFGPSYAYSEKEDVYLDSTLYMSDGGYYSVFGVLDSVKIGNKVQINFVFSSLDNVEELTFKDKNNNVIKVNGNLFDKDYKLNEELYKNLYKEYVDILPKYSFDFFIEDNKYKFDKISKN